MKILIAPQAFKGGLRGMEAAQAIAAGVRRVYPDATLVLLPVADGGDGTLDALIGGGVPSALGHGGAGMMAGGASAHARLSYSLVQGPLGERLWALWGDMPDNRTAVVELARASGLALVALDRRNPLRASTYGTGQLILAALNAGYPRIIVGLGGSATNDGGAGIAQALGARFLDAAGAELPLGGAALAHLAHVDLSGLDVRVQEARILAAADVSNPLCGPEGAAATYGPQKGATPEMVAEMDAALANFGRVIMKDLGMDVMSLPRMGAAGGAGAGMYALLGAEVGSGADIVCNALGLDAALAGADLVIVGEGCTDWQTVYDKAPIVVARRARKKGVPVIAVSGSRGKGWEAVLQHGVSIAEAAAPPDMPLAEAMARAPSLLTEAAERAVQQWAVPQYPSFPTREEGKGG